ncbi:hypothetical protein ACKC9G_09190 [Pokkaliibacter sp. CJK22405]|uniref:hypothetical protein n=1 Tax=Pokkaliibacter sp. CJK22405 TaxID=3384615 RepID=UPI0039851B1B
MMANTSEGMSMAAGWLSQLRQDANLWLQQLEATDAGGLTSALEQALSLLRLENGRATAARYLLDAEVARLEQQHDTGLDAIQQHLRADEQGDAQDDMRAQLVLEERLRNQRLKRDETLRQEQDYGILIRALEKAREQLTAPQQAGMTLDEARALALSTLDDGLEWQRKIDYLKALREQQLTARMSGSVDGSDLSDPSDATGEPR